MADLENLRTASLYINNQLLSRGLLRNGQSIDFAEPYNGEEGDALTMARIIGVVNDLILRRDRDAEHRESLSTTLRTLRAENLRQTSDMSRLTEKQAETRRKLNISEGSESSLRTQLKGAEASIKGLKDDMARAKSMVSQTRAQCAADIRRRDRQIDALKKQLGESSRARGTGKNPCVTVITVTGDVGAEKTSGRCPGSTAEEGYDLRQETNEFLTELVKGLNHENEKLVAMLKGFRDDLRVMSGLRNELEHQQQGDGMAVNLLISMEEMEGDLNAILEHLRIILTNPSFAPIEEVMVREEEINRLRGGWEQMETRWREAVHLIDGWRKRMASNGRPVNVEELKMGLRLSPVRVRDVEETAQAVKLGLSVLQEEDEEDEEEERCQEPAVPLYSQPLCPALEESLHLVPAPTHDVQPHYHEDSPDSDCESSIYEDDDLDIHDLDTEEPNVQILGQSVAPVAMASSPLPEPPRLSPLKASGSAGNRGPIGVEARCRPRPGDFNPITEENTWDLEQDANNMPPPMANPSRDSSPRRGAQAEKVTIRREEGMRCEEEIAPKAVLLDSSTSSLDSILLGKAPKSEASSHPNTQAATKSKPMTTTTRKLMSRPAVPTITKVNSSTGSTKDSSDPQPTRRAATRAAPEARKPVIAASSKDASKPRQARTRKDKPATSSSRTPTPTDIEQHQQQQSSTSEDSLATPGRANQSPRRNNSRLPLPRPGNPLSQQSPLTMDTIAVKLAASEKDADAARVRAKLKAVRLKNGKGRSRPSLAPSNSSGISSRAVSSETCASVESCDMADELVGEPGLGNSGDPVKRGVAVVDRGCGEVVVGEERNIDGRQVKRKRDRMATKVASRRRSTLSPWELESLISGNVGATPAK